MKQKSKTVEGRERSSAVNPRMWPIVALQVAEHVTKVAATATEPVLSGPMKKFSAGILLVVAVACSKGNQAASQAGSAAPGKAVASANPTAANPTTETFFEFTIDGKAYSIATDDVSVRNGASNTFKIFAGADRKLSVNLTIPNIDKCPCSVPAGAVDPASELGQGAVSLQHFPNPGNGLNSWYTTQTGTPPADAIKISDIGTVKNGARFVSGEFHTTVLKTESNGSGPENKDYVLAGKFRVRFETNASNGF